MFCSPWEVALPDELCFWCKEPKVFGRVVFLSTFTVCLENDMRKDSMEGTEKHKVRFQESKMENCMYGRAIPNFKNSSSDEPDHLPLKH